VPENARIGEVRLATIVFAVLVLDEKLPGNDTIMLAAGWTVLLSVIAHGVTANPVVKGWRGVRWPKQRKVLGLPS
jgi:NhaP-type Na+/H+ or K+/H+ antiporter